MAIGLEPCPFCGSAAVTIFGADRKWNASCCNCGASSVMCGSHEEAFDAWNSRVVDNDELRYLIMEIEEQCMIAREFRLIAHERKLNGYSAIKTIEYVIFGSLANRHWMRVFERLADLIEPMPPGDLIRVADILRLGDGDGRL